MHFGVGCVLFVLSPAANTALIKELSDLSGAVRKSVWCKRENVWIYDAK